MNAEMLEGQLEIRNVRPNLHLEDLPPHQCSKEEQLLGHGQDERTQRRDVGLQGIAGNSHQIFRKRDTDFPVGVLFLGDTAEALVISTFVGSNRVNQLVLGAAAVGVLVGEKDCSPAHSEQAVGNEHGTIVAEVPVQGDVLHADDQGIGTRVNLKKILGKIDRDQPCAAAHPT